jgi:16S rRNA (guanine966-N2)-methyltransferase
VRVTGGDLRGKKLCPLKGLNIRPTTDYVRELIFNILAGRVEDTVVLDLFAGTGSLGIEALSRGAKRAVFVEKERDAVRILTRNISACRLQERTSVLRRDIRRGPGFLKSSDQFFDLVFIDPPYDKGLAEHSVRLLSRTESISDEVSIVLEHSKREAVAEKIACFVLSDRRQHGITLVSFYKSMI